MVDSEASRQPGDRRARLRGWLLAVVVALYVLSVPWYRSPDAPLRIWLGLPDWVATALGCYVAAAVLTAWAWWISDVVDPEAVGEGERAGPDAETAP